MLLELTLSFAAAQPVGYYHPNDLTQASGALRAEAEQLSTAFESRQRALSAAARDLRAYREALDLLGDAAHPDDHDRLASLERDYHRQKAVLQVFADELVEDFDIAAKGAVQRAAEPLGELVQCVAEIPDGPQVPGMRPRTKANPECTGTDMNPTMAQAMDQDAELGEALAALRERPWPDLQLESVPQRSSNGAERWVSFRTLLVTAADGPLRRIDQQDDELRMEIGAALEQEDVDLDALKAREAEIEQITATARRALASPVLQTATKRMVRWKGGSELGWCAQPASFGGCTGIDATTEVVQRLMDDRKFVRVLPR